MSALDLDAIEARRDTAENVYAITDGFGPVEMIASLQDVPALVAEVRELRARIDAALHLAEHNTLATPPQVLEQLRGARE